MMHAKRRFLRRPVCPARLMVVLASLLPGLALAQDSTEYPDANAPVAGAVQHVPTGHPGSQSADTELLLYMLNNHERFVGMTMEFGNGEVVGPILGLRRRVDDLELFLIVDATPWFNDEVIYAVNARDVRRHEGSSVTVVEGAGMHLRGLVYYPDDYTDVDDFNPEGYSPGSPQ